MNNDIWKSDRLISKDKCYECGSCDDIHYHHIIPMSLGGIKTIPLCSECHGKIHGMVLTKKHIQRIGIEKAKKEGRYKGRKAGSMYTDQEFLNKYKTVVDSLVSGNTFRKTAEIGNCSVGTVQKVREVLKKLTDD